MNADLVYKRDRMKPARKLSFLTLIAVLTLGLSACHEKKTGNGADPNGPVFVEDYSGPARNFSGNYTSTSDDGFCRLEVGGWVYTNCQISIFIQQTNRRFSIRSTFRIINPASNRNGTIKNVVVESMRLQRNILLSQSNEAGIVGKAAFRYQTAESQLSMASDGLSKFRLTGSYLTESGERVQITGRVGFPRRRH